ncbi:hypothetical protein [Archangium sp.]|nr:hypothetical protein [Archangium sp.]HYO57890.1 hypothetical protein [Archangium sp.]
MEAVTWRGEEGRVPPTVPEALAKLLAAVSAPLARTQGLVRSRQSR